jgi:hypothetical protein
VVRSGRVARFDVGPIRGRGEADSRFAPGNGGGIILSRQGIFEQFSVSTVHVKVEEFVLPFPECPLDATYQVRMILENPELSQLERIYDD